MTSLLPREFLFYCDVTIKVNPPSTETFRIWVIQCDGELEAGILCGPQFDFDVSASGSLGSTDISPTTDATAGIPYLGLARNTTTDDPRCNGTAIASPNLTPASASPPNACASILGLNPPFSDFGNCEFSPVILPGNQIQLTHSTGCETIDTCYCRSQLNCLSEKATVKLIFMLQTVPQRMAYMTAQQPLAPATRSSTNAHKTPVNSTTPLPKRAVK